MYIGTFDISTRCARGTQRRSFTLVYFEFVAILLVPSPRLCLRSGRRMLKISLYGQYSLVRSFYLYLSSLSFSIFLMVSVFLKTFRAVLLLFNILVLYIPIPILYHPNHLRIIKNKIITQAFEISFCMTHKFTA